MFIKNYYNKTWIIFGTFLFLFIFVVDVSAGSPSGDDYFELLTNVVTGGDATGDGGTGHTNDYNYYYVGQSLSTLISIRTAGASTANIWVDYDSTMFTANSVDIGNFFSAFSGQTINATARGAGLGRVYSTGFNVSGGQSSGLGNFGSITWTANKPSASNYGRNSPSIFDINIGTIGSTTESNIALSGIDLLDSAEDFYTHVWADTKNPFALDPSPADGATGVAVTSNFVFDLRDTLNGEGDNTGVGTGVNTSEPPGAISISDGGAGVDVTAYDSFNCSGLWGTNLCTVTVNPLSPVAIGGDTRNWEYGTAYTVTISGFRDYASASQSQLGDANGPNTMLTKIYTFSTLADSVKPRVVSETPVRSSSGGDVSSNIVVTLEDRLTYLSGASGTGIDSATCRINITTDSSPLTTYQQGGSGVTVVAVSYGYRFTIDRVSDFLESETVAVSVYDCTDLAGNIMTTDNYIFSTEDTASPRVEDLTPVNDAIIARDGKILFSLKDDGSGVNLSSTVVYVNGEYWTNSGGAGQVTISGTRITFGSSYLFSSNYIGDTTSVTGDSTNYAFQIDPSTNFLVGESVPVIIYSMDLAGNIMERFVYGVSTESSSQCLAGSTYCGQNTSWDGSSCVAVSCPTSSGGGGAIYSLELFGGMRQDTVQVVQVDERSVLVSWHSISAVTSKLLYDRVSRHGNDISSRPSPLYGYAFVRDVNTIPSTYHAVTITNLVPGQIYYFRPYNEIYGRIYFGLEVRMAPKFKTVSEDKIIYQEVEVEKIVYRDRIIKECPSYVRDAPAPSVVRVPQPASPVQIPPEEEYRRLVDTDLPVLNIPILESESEVRIPQDHIIYIDGKELDKSRSVYSLVPGTKQLSLSGITNPSSVITILNF